MTIADLWNTLRNKKLRHAFGVKLTRCTRRGEPVVSGYDLSESTLNLWYKGERVTRLETAGEYGCILYCGERFVRVVWRDSVEVRE